MALTTIAGTSGAIQGSVAQAIEGRRSDLKGRLFELSLVACLFVSLLVLLLMISDIVRNGFPVYTDRGWDFLNGGLSSTAARAGIAQGIIGSFWIAVTVCVVSIPLGIGAAVYLEEYAPRNRLTSFIEINVRNLAGVPSVVYGLLGPGPVRRGAGRLQRQGRRLALDPHRRRAHAGGAGAAHHHHHHRRGDPGRAQRAARGRLRRGRHPLGGHPLAGAALRHARHRDRLAAGHRPGGGRGGAPDPGGRADRPGRPLARA